MNDIEIKLRDIKPVNICFPIELFDSKMQVFQFLNLILDVFDRQKDSKLTFHYFFENGIIEVRMKIYSDYVDTIVKFINEYFKGKEELVARSPIEFKDYIPENTSDKYGDGWDIVEKMFEYFARAALYIIRKNPQNLFRETKLIHCFMNQLGHDTLREAAFYNWISGNMMMKYFRELDELGLELE